LPPDAVSPGAHAACRALRTRPWLAAGTLAAWVALAVVAARLNSLRLALLEHARLGGAFPAPMLSDVEQRMDDLAAVELALLASTFAAIVAWMHRAYANLDALGVRFCHYTP